MARHYIVILEDNSFSLPPSLEECPRLLSSIINCRLAAGMKPSCRRLKFFTSLKDERVKNGVEKVPIDRKKWGKIR